MKMKKQNAFTLIELLVVISIIALLLGILMPVLGKARNEGKSALCMSNLRQFVFAAEMYASNYNNYYPPGYVKKPDITGSLAVETCWDFIHTKDRDTGEQTTEPGLLWMGEIKQKIQQCPAFKGNANSDDPYTGYNYNTSYIGREKQYFPTTAKVEEVKNPADCIIFGDGEYYDGANKYMRSPFKSQFDKFDFRAAGTQGFRHNDKTNIAWCDSHISSQKKYYTETPAGEKTKLEQYNKTGRVKIGFISPDNSAYDLK